LVLATRIDGREDLRVSPGEFESLLLRDWSVSKIPVVFDFGEDVLWGLLQKQAGGKKYVFRVERRALIESLKPPQQSNSSFEELLGGYIRKIEAHEWYLRKWQKEQSDLLRAQIRRRGPGRHFRL
jgi:hypothetical protein